MTARGSSFVLTDEARDCDGSGRRGRAARRRAAARGRARALGRDDAARGATRVAGAGLRPARRGGARPWARSGGDGLARGRPDGAGGTCGPGAGDDPHRAHPGHGRRPRSRRVVHGRARADASPERLWLPHGMGARRPRLGQAPAGMVLRLGERSRRTVSDLRALRARAGGHHAALGRGRAAVGPLRLGQRRAVGARARGVAPPRSARRVAERSSQRSLDVPSWPTWRSNSGSWDAAYLSPQLLRRGGGGGASHRPGRRRRRRRSALRWRRSRRRPRRDYRSRR